MKDLETFKTKLSNEISLIPMRGGRKYKHTPALSYGQDFKKGRNKRSMDSGPILHTDTGKYCQNLETLGKSDF